MWPFKLCGFTRRYTLNLAVAPAKVNVDRVNFGPDLFGPRGDVHIRMQSIHQNSIFKKCGGDYLNSPINGLCDFSQPTLISVFNLVMHAI